LFLDNNLPDGLGWEQVSFFLKKNPQLRLNLISAYRPETPKLPEKTIFQVVEKPISLRDIDRYIN
jgi:hypothetical protein